MQNVNMCKAEAAENVSSSFFKNLDGFACTSTSILTSVRSQIGRHGLIEFKTSVIKLKSWGEIGSS